jgi:phosphoribosylglycinamide formyltransferase-1
MNAVKALDAVVLLSGSGTTFQNLLDRSRTGSLALNIRGVVSSRAGAFGIERAKAAGVPTRVVSKKDYADAAAFSAAVFREVDAFAPQLIVLAGWMSLIVLPEKYAGKVINIHPALLPQFGGKGMYGIHVHEAVIAAGERETGCTVHSVDNEYDHGEVILQKRCPVEPGDTPESLQARVQTLEREAYPEAINLIAVAKARTPT